MSTEHKHPRTEVVRLILDDVPTLGIWTEWPADCPIKPEDVPEIGTVVDVREDETFELEDRRPRWSRRARGWYFSGYDSDGILVFRLCSLILAAYRAQQEKAHPCHWCGSRMVYEVSNGLWWCTQSGCAAAHSRAQQEPKGPCPKKIERYAGSYECGYRFSEKRPCRLPSGHNGPCLPERRSGKDRRTSGHVIGHRGGAISNNRAHPAVSIAGRGGNDAHQRTRRSGTDRRQSDG